MCLENIFWFRSSFFCGPQCQTCLPKSTTGSAYLIVIRPQDDSRMCPGLQSANLVAQVCCVCVCVIVCVCARIVQRRALGCSFVCLFVPALGLPACRFRFKCGIRQSLLQEVFGGPVFGFGNVVQVRALWCRLAYVFVHLLLPRRWVVHGRHTRISVSVDVCELVLFRANPCLCVANPNPNPCPCVELRHVRRCRGYSKVQTMWQRFVELGWG